MNSWEQLLLLDLARGRYLTKRQPTEQDWWALWGLVYQMEHMRT